MDIAALLGMTVGGVFGNKIRSALTVLGITIGIAAVICVVAIGRAGQAQIEQQLSNLGDNFVWIEAGGRRVGGVWTGNRATKTMTLEDAEAIKDQIPLIKSVSPNVDASAQLVYGTQNWFTGYRGVGRRSTLEVELAFEGLQAVEVLQLLGRADLQQDKRIAERGGAEVAEPHALGLIGDLLEVFHDLVVAHQLLVAANAESKILLG